MRVLETVMVDPVLVVVDNGSDIGVLMIKDTRQEEVMK